MKTQFSLILSICLFLPLLAVNAMLRPRLATAVVGGRVALLQAAPLAADPPYQLFLPEIARAGLPDLTISVGYDGGTFTPCGTPPPDLGVRVWVENIGQTDAGAFAVTLTAGSHTVTQTVSAGLAAGQKTSLLFGYVPFDVTAMADAAYQVVESREDNNQASTSIPVLTQAPPCVPSVSPTATTTAPPTASPTPTHPTSTPVLTITPTGHPCSPPTAEPLWVEPVTSPTDRLSQVVTVRIGHGEAVTITTVSGVFGVTGTFDAYANPALVAVDLLPDTTHSLQVAAHVWAYNPGNGCIYAYTLTTTYDRNGDPLIIVTQ